MKQSFLRRFWRARDGATIVEFAIVAPIFFLIILAIIEFGLFMFHKVAIEAIAMQVGREATIGRDAAASGPCSSTASRAAYIRCYVEQKAGGLIDSGEVQVNINPVADGGIEIPPDICIDNPNRPSSAPASCARWEEVNGVSGYQNVTDMNAGEAGELVEVRISYPWRVLLPFMKRFMGSATEGGDTTGTVMITSSTIIKNEPFE